MGTTKIEWCDKTWSPVTGCSPVSEGCEHCWAERFSKRLAGRCGYPADEPFRVTLHPGRLDEPLRWRKPRRVFVCSMGDLFHPDVPDEFITKTWDIMWKAKQHTFLVLTKRPERMKQWITDNAYAGHFSWVKRERDPFSPGDLIHIDDLWMRNMCGWATGNKCDCNNGYVCGYPPDEDSDKCEHGNRLCMSYNCPVASSDPSEKVLKENGLGGQYDIDNEGCSIDCDCMELHTRPRNAFVPNVWLGVTAENQARADERIPILLQIPAAVRLVSVEPTLGPIEIDYYFPRYDYRPTYEYFRMAYGLTNDKPVLIRPGVDWVICGGESGPGARPMRPSWARSLRDQCQESGVPFFFKSWGEWVSPSQMPGHVYREIEDFGDGIGITDNPRKVGKQRAGRLLDGREWNEFPKPMNEGRKNE